MQYILLKKIFYIFLFVLSLYLISKEPILAAGPSHGGKGQYDRAVRYVKEHNYDIALMEFLSIIRNFPESIYAKRSLFAIGEYFYEKNAYSEAIKHFTKYIGDYPDYDDAIFARAYLLKIIEDVKESPEENKVFIENIEADFFSQPLFLLFSEYKEETYKSALRNDFTIHHYIDMIEVYRNGELFIKLTQ
ncbi:tol-pal system YbgF family protein [Candidatus Omnitrophota bacterium]